MSRRIGIRETPNIFFVITDHQQWKMMAVAGSFMVHVSGMGGLTVADTGPGV